MRPVTPEAEKLRLRLAEINLHAERTALTADLAPMRAQIRLLQALLSKAGSGAGAPPDRIHQAVVRYATTGEFDGARGARLVCWGTLLPWAGEGSALIEDESRFPALLDRVDRLRAEPRPYRRCWRGLLDGYFRYDPQGPAAGNWRLLRGYLHDTRGALAAPGHQPEWVTAVQGHPELLTDQPARRYGAALLAGDTTEVDQLRGALAVDGASWFTRSLVDGQIDAAVEMGDAAFQAVLPAAIDLLNAHPLSADAGLARLLDRYARCEPCDVHAGLRDFSVGRWGNPWLQLNDAKWGRVAEDARRMIADWLKLDFIEKFFSLLSADQMNDARRLQFWRRYHSHIDDMYFALGDTASRNQSADFKDLRRRMAGRMLTLEQTNSPNNNAFIMRIGGYWFVEFGEKGNALFVFDAARLPFNLSRSYIAATRAALKHPNHVRRLTHTDSGWQTWEHRCREAIEELTGIRPGDEQTSRRSSTGRAPEPRRPLRPAPPAPPPSSGGLPASGVLSFLTYHGIAFTDLRAKGGSLWVEAPNDRGEVARQLKAWGFAWSARREAWYWKTA